MSARDAAIQAVKDHPSTTFMAPYESLADAVLAAATPQIRAEAFHEAADAIDNDDECGCGGCDTCQPRKLAVMLREKAGEAAAVPLVVSRYDVAMEPAPEEEPVLTVGAVAEDGSPVTLLFDPETRRKVAGWLAPGDGAELERLRAFASATERRHNEIRARLAMVDIRDSAEAWDLGMAIIAILDGPLHPAEGAAPPIAARFRAHVYDVLNEAASTGAFPALKLAQVRQYLTEVIAHGLLERHGAAEGTPARATEDTPGEGT